MIEVPGFETLGVDALLATGSKLADGAVTIAGINLAAFQKAMHGQLRLGSALVEFGSEQLRSLTQITAPAEFLQRQRVIGETLVTAFTGTIEDFREIGMQTQAAYAEAGQAFAADLGMKTA